MADDLRTRARRRGLSQTGVTKALRRRGKEVDPAKIRSRTLRARGFGRAQQLMSEHMTKILGEPRTPREARMRTSATREGVRSRMSKSFRRTGKRFRPNPRFAQLGKIARSFGKLSVAGMALEAYDWYKAMKKIKEPKRQEM